MIETLTIIAPSDPDLDDGLGGLRSAARARIGADALKYPKYRLHPVEISDHSVAGHVGARLQGCVIVLRATGVAGADHASTGGQFLGWMRGLVLSLLLQVLGCFHRDLRNSGGAGADWSRYRADHPLVGIGLVIIIDTSTNDPVAQKLAARIGWSGLIDTKTSLGQAMQRATGAAMERESIVIHYPAPPQRIEPAPMRPTNSVFARLCLPTSASGGANRALRRIGSFLGLGSAADRPAEECADEGLDAFVLDLTHGRSLTDALVGLRQGHGEGRMALGDNATRPLVLVLQLGDDGPPEPAILAAEMAAVFKHEVRVWRLADPSEFDGRNAYYVIVPLDVDVESSGTVAMVGLGARR